MTEEVGQTSQRGPSTAAKNIYKARAPQRFMDEIIATGKYVTAVDETTGQGVFVGQFNPTSHKTESGRDIALVLFEVFLADESKCCGGPTKRSRKAGVYGPHKCTVCGEECETTPEWIRKPTYIPNPRTGSRVAIWNQAIVQWSLIPAVLKGMASLHGGAVEAKKEEVQATKDVAGDRMIAELRRYGI